MRQSRSDGSRIDSGAFRMRFDPVEAGALRWLLDGRLSEPEIVSALLAALGLCPRHAWGLLGAGTMRRHVPQDERCLVCARLQAQAAPTAAPIADVPRFRALLELAAPRLASVACPHCLGGAGIPCRPHLAAGAAPGRGLSRRLGHMADDLEDRRDELPADVHSLSQDEAAIWVESLGWLSGWRFVTLLHDADRRELHGALIG